MEKDDLAKSSDTSIEKEGFISKFLSKDGISNQSLPDDHIGIENISVEPNKLYEAGGRAFAFSPERAWVHFQDITVLDNGQLSFVMAVNSSISRYLCDKK